MLRALRRRICPVSAGSGPIGPNCRPHRAGKGGFNAQGWTQGGLNLLAVSEIPADELEQFVVELRRRTE
jgi:hypothetical protein